MTRRDIFKMFAGGASLPAVKSVEVLDVKKDDTIVLKFPERLTHNAIFRTYEVMAMNFPEQKVIVLDGGADIEVLRAR